MMGSLDSTSAWYIFTMPLFTCMPLVRGKRVRACRVKSVG